jgi:hypothetical protein
LFQEGWESVGHSDRADCDKGIWQGTIICDYRLDSDSADEEDQHKLIWSELAARPSRHCTERDNQKEVSQNCSNNGVDINSSEDRC